jgi:hypothetical protein
LVGWGTPPPDDGRPPAVDALGGAPAALVVGDGEPPMVDGTPPTVGTLGSEPGRPVPVDGVPPDGDGVPKVVLVPRPGAVAVVLGVVPGVAVTVGPVSGGGVVSSGVGVVPMVVPVVVPGVLGVGLMVVGEERLGAAGVPGAGVVLGAVSDGGVVTCATFGLAGRGRTRSPIGMPATIVDEEIGAPPVKKAANKPTGGSAARTQEDPKCIANLHGKSLRRLCQLRVALTSSILRASI